MGLERLRAAMPFTTTPAILLYICIPAHDEAETIGVLLWKIRQVMSDFGRDYQLLVLDDGSTDDTSEILAPYTSVLPLSVLRNETREGYARSVERLVREVVQRTTHPRRDVFVLLQGDFTESPEAIPEMVKRIEGGVDVVGAAPVQDGDAERSRFERWLRKGLPWLLRRSGVPKEAGDPLTGYRAYRIESLRRALRERNGSPLFEGDGWAVNAELLIAVLPHARRTAVTDVGVRYDLRGRSSRLRPLEEARGIWRIRSAARTLRERDEEAA